MFFLKELGGVPGVEGDGTQRIFDLVGNGGQEGRLGIVKGAQPQILFHQKELLPLTGYVHGGCSPVGMKKLFPTVFHSSAENLETMIVSAGKIGYQVELAPHDLAALVRAKFADIIV